MDTLLLVGGALTLGVTVVAGVVAHELAHAAVLHAVGIPYEITWLREHERSFDRDLAGTWASVTPTQIPSSAPAWGVRLAAMAPLVLTVPVLLVVAGLLPDPLSAGNVPGTAVTVALLACGLPSPRDFSIFWYPERAISEASGSPPG